ncbi:MAG TPA: NAD(P)-dependent oxidoreductase [Alphaproteobacteria bacterium]|nr:NAD(P)-dependent oxidoreductase [Alphaproteobacteria bacterium]
MTAPGTETRPSLRGKVLFVTGASRGIGLEIALRAAEDGACIALAAKTVEPHPTLPGTLASAAEAIKRAGGEALPLQLDIRDERRVEAAVAEAAAHFGAIDILVNNASAISLTSTLDTPAKRYDLMMSVNARGTFLASRACLPHLLRAANPHILTLSPPLDLSPRWFAPHVAYTISKYAMSLAVLGLAAEFRAAGVAVNALWPRTLIATAALRMIPGIDARRARTPRIVADAAHAILTRPSRGTTGRFFIDEDVLREAGVSDFAPYAAEPGLDPLPDLFVR